MTPMFRSALLAAAADPTDRAFDGGGLVTPWPPTGDRTGRGAGSGT